MMSVEKQSPCKINLLLNILGRRPDGFHELETLMHPVSLFDRLAFKEAPQGVRLTCNDPELPLDAGNLVYRAAEAFLKRASIRQGVEIHLDKQIPKAAGLGGGSGNAGTTLLGLNELFRSPLEPQALTEIASSLGSDIPFFLQTRPALGTGRGEKIEPLETFPSVAGAGLLLIHPGFGISTPWAYQQLKRFPSALNGRPGRAMDLARVLQGGTLEEASGRLYNSLEAPAFEKFPILVLFQEFLRENGAAATLMSGSGSTTFAITRNPEAAQELGARFAERFGENNWIRAVPV